MEGKRKHYKDHEQGFWRLAQIYRDILPDRTSLRGLVMNRLSTQFVSQLLCYCALPQNRTTLEQMKLFVERVRAAEPTIIQEAMKKSIFTRTLLKTRYFAYPILRTMFLIKGE